MSLLSMNSLLKLAKVFMLFQNKNLKTNTRKKYTAFVHSNVSFKLHVMSKNTKHSITFKLV